AGFENWYYVPAYTDPNISSTFFRAGQESAGHYFTLNPEIFGASINFKISSHLICDAPFAGRGGMAPPFVGKGGFDESGLTVSVLEREWTLMAKTYSVHIPREELTPGWKTITLPLSRFATDDGKRPGHWQDLEKLQLRGVTSKQEPPCFTHFRW